MGCVSGLASYGDPLDPYGDVKDMQMLSCLIKPGGLLFLGVPMGPDAIVFNAHRIYGRVRLPMMTANFEVLQVVRNASVTHLGELWDQIPGVHGPQPVIVLRNMRHEPCVQPHTITR